MSNDEIKEPENMEEALKILKEKAPNIRVEYGDGSRTRHIVEIDKLAHKIVDWCNENEYDCEMIIIDVKNRKTGVKDRINILGNEGVWDWEELK